MAVAASFGTGRFSPSSLATGFSAGMISSDAYYYETTTQDLSYPPVIFMGGGGTQPTNTPNAFASGGASVVNALIAAGFTVLQPTVAWLLGNPESRTRITDAVNYGTGTLGLDSSRPPFVCGISNGGYCALNWARYHAVSGLGLITVPPDLQEIRDNMDYLEEVLGDLRGKVDVAWGVTYPAPLPAGANAYPDRDLWLGVRIQQWIATDDVIGERWQEAFACHVDADMRSVGRLGHTPDAAEAVDTALFVDFVERCFEAAS